MSRLVASGPRGYAAEVLADGPVLYWRTGEASGTIANDFSGHGLTGTYVGATLAQAGAIGAEPNGTADTATLFNGSTGKLTTPDITALHLVSGTYEAWIKYTTSGVWALLGNNDLDTDRNGTALFLASPTVLDFETCSAAARILVMGSTAATNDGKWHHVACTWNGNGNAAFVYLDGQQVGTGTQNLVTAWAANPMTAAKNANAGQAGQYPFPGSMDEIAVYPSPLSAARLLVHYNAGLNQNTSLSGSPRLVAVPRSIAVARTIATTRTVAA